MELGLDACSIINLRKAGALAAVLGLEQANFSVCPTVLRECGPILAAELLAFKNAGCLEFVADEHISVDRVLELVGDHNIGDGEIETIVVCETLGRSLCSDDRPARQLGNIILGADRVVGSARLLRWCVEENAMTCDETFDRYQQMRQHGAFVPTLAHSFFCAADC